MRRSIGLLAAAVVLSLGVSAKADILFDFQNDASPWGNSVAYSTNQVTFAGYSATAPESNPTYNSSLGTVTATGYSVTTPGSDQLILSGGQNLYSKWNGLGSDESGLGLNNTPDNEIDINHAIQLDFTNVINVTGDRYVNLSIGSVQKDEGFTIYNGTGTSLTPVYSFLNPNDTPTIFPVQLDTQTYGDVFYVTAYYGGDTSNNVLVVAGVQTTNVVEQAVPEPSTLAIAGLGALGFGAHLWRRRRSR